MPDLEHKTVSASQMPALFGVSPYQSRWMLWQHFATRAPLIDDRDDTKDWGSALQAPILDWVSRELRLDAVPHSDYLRHPTLPVGCTPDGWVRDPIEGLGTIEAKAVNTWSPQEYEGGRCPLHVELQVQTQLMVPHPEWGLPRWGVIAATLGGTPPQLWRRKADPVVQEKIRCEAELFLDSVRTGNEPAIDGMSAEIPWLLERYPPRPPAEARWIESGEEAALLASLRHWSEQARIAEGTKDALRAKVIALAAGAELLNVPTFDAPGPIGTSAARVGGFIAKVNRIPVAAQMRGVPDAARQQLGVARHLINKTRNAIELDEHEIVQRSLTELDNLLLGIASYTEQSRKASTQVRITFKDAAGLAAPGSPIDPGPMEE